MKNTEEKKTGRKTVIITGAVTGFLAGAAYQIITLYSVLHLPLRSVIVGAAITGIVCSVAGAFMNISISKRAGSKKETAGQS